MSSDTVIIIPAYNEAGGIAKLIAEIRSKAPGLDIAVVDDGSSDGTRPRLQRREQPPSDILSTWVTAARSRPGSNTPSPRAILMPCR